MGRHSEPLPGTLQYEERVDHRSHAKRGFDEQPTIHEGVVARSLEKKGIISDHCELNRQIKERRTLLEEKKNTPAIQIFRHRELVQKIAGLTEDIEELKSEKVLLLNQFNCAGNHGMDKIKQHIASMESSLETLNQQEEKYTAELDTALTQYTELQQQATDMDAMELDTARHAVRSSKERETVQRLQAAHSKKFDSGALAQS